LKAFYNATLENHLKTMEEFNKAKVKSNKSKH